jgi:hypothetical protein
MNQIVTPSLPTVVQARELFASRDSDSGWSIQLVEPRSGRCTTLMAYLPRRLRLTRSPTPAAILRLDGLATAKRTGKELTDH